MFTLSPKIIQRLSIALFVGFLLWGGYSLLVYYGIPVHNAVLMPAGGEGELTEQCGKEAYVCRGIAALLPSIINTFERAAPFLPYALVSGSLYLLMLGMVAFKTGRFDLRFTLKPYKIYLLFIASLWLLFSVLSTGHVSQSDGEVSVRRVIEPHPEVYTNVEAEALQALQDNFDRLLGNGCLEFVRDIRPDIREFEMKVSCIQQHFFIRVMSQVVFVTMIILLFLTTGRALLHLMRVRPDTLLLESAMSVAAGACAWIVLLWLISIIGLLFTVTGWLMIALVLLACYKHARYWLLIFFTHEWNLDRKWYDAGVICAWLLISYLAFNFLTVVRPFPIGWDDLGSYLNRPRQLVSFGSFLHSMSSFQWEYVTSMGYLLYGLESIFGSTAAMMINWLAGLMAVFVILAFSATFLGGSAGSLAALIYYTLPMVGHFSFADMKTDNAVFAFQAVSMLALFWWLFKRHEGEEDDIRDVSKWQWLLLAGMYCGFAFGTKITAIMVFMTLGFVLMGVLLNGYAAAGVFFLSWFAFIEAGGLNINQTLERVGMQSLSQSGFIIATVVAGLACFAVAIYKNPERVRRAFIAGGMVIGGFALSISPWILHNNIQRGNVIPKLELKGLNTITPVLDHAGVVYNDEDLNSNVDVRVLPEELRTDREHPACKSTAREEELGRYWGFREGWGHYITLPWRTVMNIDSAGYYVTTSPALLLFPLLLLLPFFWKKSSRWLRWLFAATLYLLLQWMLMANGVPWYGIGIFLGLCVGIEALTLRSPDKPNRVIAWILIACGLISCFAMRFWQFEQQRNLLEYSMGKVTALTMRERTIPYYDDITDIVMQRHETMPDRPFLYRVGTFIPYFVPRNLEIIAANDHQLSLFNCLFQERDPELTLKRLKAFGFNSIIFDTNTATIEKNPNGTLHKKVQAFVDFLNDPRLNLQVVLNKPSAGVVFVLIP